LTSAGLDQIATYAETLCGGSVHRYRFDGKCRAMQFFDAGSMTTMRALGRSRSIGPCMDR
jgi:hypothetical protein